MKRYLYILFLATTVVACSKYDDCGDLGNPGNYYLRGIAGDFVQIDSMRPAGSVMLDYEEAVVVLITESYVADASPYQHTGWSLFPKAMACSPAEPDPRYISTLTISALDTLYLGDSVLAPNTKLNSYFKPLSSYSDFLDSPFRIRDYQHEIQLKERPDRPVNTTIVFDIVQSNGDTFNGTASGVMIN